MRAVQKAHSAAGTEVRRGCSSIAPFCARFVASAGTLVDPTPAAAPGMDRGGDSLGHSAEVAASGRSCGGQAAPHQLGEVSLAIRVGRKRAVGGPSGAHLARAAVAQRRDDRPGDRRHADRQTCPPDGRRGQAVGPLPSAFRPRAYHGDGGGGRAWDHSALGLAGVETAQQRRHRLREADRPGSRAGPGLCPACGRAGAGVVRCLLPVRPGHACLRRPGLYLVFGGREESPLLAREHAAHGQALPLWSGLGETHRTSRACCGARAAGAG